MIAGIPSTTAGIGAMLLISCAHPAPQLVSQLAPAHQDERPHISWVLSTGGDGTEPEKTVCQSESQQSCVLQASTARRQSIATMHLYLHPAATEIAYQGSVIVGFMSDGVETSHVVEVNHVVSPGSNPVNASATGPVTDKAGIYKLQITLKATPAGQPASPIQEEVTVAVK